MQHNTYAVQGRLREDIAPLSKSNSAWRISGCRLRGARWGTTMAKVWPKRDFFPLSDTCFNISWKKLALDTTYKNEFPLLATFFQMIFNWNVTNNKCAYTSGYMFVFFGVWKQTRLYHCQFHFELCIIMSDGAWKRSKQYATSINLAHYRSERNHST